jgi:hypothetical protein
VVNLRLVKGWRNFLITLLALFVMMGSCFAQLLGRATSVGAYVKRGEESGYIKISLRGDTEDEQITIMRKVDTHNKSEWLFNGKIFNT